jgi:hypothetical protein
MTMQTDVKMSHMNSDGVATAFRSRLRGYQIAPGGTAGQINIYDNATTNSGNLVLAVDVTTNTAIISTLIPAEGIIAYNGMYVSMPTGTTMTIFWS